MRLIDLSNNNEGPMDFVAVKRAGYSGLWHKVSEGTTFADPDFRKRATAARIVGLRVGGYHFARPVVGNEASEARYFVGLLGKVGPRDLCPVLDLEANDAHLTPTELHLWARKFLEVVHATAGVRGLLYSGPAFIREQGWSTTLGTGRGLWLADYGPNDGKRHKPDVPRPWRRCAAHQYTSIGHVPGLEGFVDLSYARFRHRVLAHPWRGLL